MNGTPPPVVVFVSGNWLEAEVVASALEGHDIPSLILDDNICRILPTAAFVVGGAKVVVDGRALLFLPLVWWRRPQLTDDPVEDGGPLSS